MTCIDNEKFQPVDDGMESAIKLIKLIIETMNRTPTSRQQFYFLSIIIQYMSMYTIVRRL